MLNTEQLLCAAFTAEYIIDNGTGRGGAPHQMFIPGGRYPCYATEYRGYNMGWGIVWPRPDCYTGKTYVAEELFIIWCLYAYPKYTVLKNALV